MGIEARERLKSEIGVREIIAKYLHSENDGNDIGDLISKSYIILVGISIHTMCTEIYLSASQMSEIFIISGISEVKLFGFKYFLWFYHKNKNYKTSGCSFFIFSFLFISSHTLHFEKMFFST